MAKQYKIKINGGPAGKQVLDLEQGMGDRGQALRIKAAAGVRYQLEDSATGFAPENIRAKRVGNDLRLSMEGSLEADIVIENYYEVMPAGYNAVIGQAESGRFYEYIPESASGAASVQALSPNSSPVGMALGGAEVQDSGAAVGVLAAAAFNPLLLAPLGLLALAGAGGGGGSSNSASKPVATAHLTADAVNDTGAKNDDGVTSNNHPEISGTATPNSLVSVTLNNKTYTTTAGANGTYKVQVPDADTLPDGVYTAKVESSLNGQSSGVIDGTPFVIDTSSANNYSPNSNPATVPDANAKATVAITSLVDVATQSNDSGPSNSDFITNDATLTYKGIVSGFVSNGDYVLLKLLDSSNTVVATAYVAPDSTGAWSWNRTGFTQADGTYTLSATLVDASGNAVNATSAGMATQKIVIDTSNANNYSPNAVADPNAKATVDIIAITPDTGVSGNDFVTNNNALTYKGKVTGYTANGDVLILELKDAAGAVVSTSTVTPGADGSWSWDNTGVNRADGTYSLKATLVDLAGNTVNLTVPTGANLTGGGYDTQAVVIDTSTSQNYKPLAQSDANTTAKVNITSIIDAGSDSKDTGTYNNDFVTNDQTLSYKGTVTDAAGKLLMSTWVQVELKDAAGVVKASDYKQTDAQGNWLWNNTASTTPEGTYTIVATVVDEAGNKVSPSVTHSLKIDLTAPPSGPSGIQMVDSGVVDFGTPLFGTDTDKITNSPVFSYSPSETGQGVLTQFSLDAGKTWTTASAYPIDLNKDGVVDGTYSQLQLRNIDPAGNIGPATQYGVPFTIDTKAPQITQFAFDIAAKSVGFSVNESGYYSYTLLDAANQPTTTPNWTYVAVSPQSTKSASIALPSGSYAKGHFVLVFQDIAGNEVTVSNATDWTLASTTPSSLQTATGLSSQASGTIYPSETMLDLQQVMTSPSVSASDAIKRTSSGAATLQWADLMSTASQTNPLSNAAHTSAATGLTGWPDLIDQSPSSQTLSKESVATQLSPQLWPEESLHAATLVIH
jgi:hypothetical protein